MKETTEKEKKEFKPMDEVVYGEVTFPALIAHPEHGRPIHPEMCFILEVETLRLIGWSASPTGSADVKAALDDAIRNVGVPSIVYADPDYVNKSTGMNADNIDQVRSRRLIRQINEEIRTTGRSSILPTWAEFLDMCVQEMDNYNNTPIDILPEITDESGQQRHMTPNECWEMWLQKGWEPVKAPEGWDAQ